MKFFNIKTIIFFAIFVFGLVLSIPSIFGTNGPKITLGLDLQGGLNILLGVDVNGAVESKYSSLATQINYDTQNSDILIDSLHSSDSDVSFELLDISKKAKIRSNKTGKTKTNSTNA